MGTAGRVPAALGQQRLEKRNSACISKALLASTITFFGAYFEWPQKVMVPVKSRQCR